METALMARTDIPMTQAVRFLRARAIAFAPHPYPYEAHGGTGHAARCLGVSEHAVVKTLVFETDGGRPLLMLMHGDCNVSTKQLARELGVRQVNPASEAAAQKVTGYQVGGISPFGTRQSVPVYVEAAILELDRIYINGGKRGFLVEIDPAHLREALNAQPVNVAQHNRVSTT
jgi:Cys-tRNA(Pro) deacylase